MAARVDISKSTVLRVWHNNLNINKASTRWVYNIFLYFKRMECWRDFLNACQDNERKAISSIVTGDETKILYSNPLLKRESMNW